MCLRPQTQLTAIGGHVAPARHHAVLVGHGAASGQSHGLDVAVEGGGTAQFDQHDVVVQVVAVVLWVLDHFGTIDPLLSALVHSDVVLAETHLDTTGGSNERERELEFSFKKTELSDHHEPIEHFLYFL